MPKENHSYMYETEAKSCNSFRSNAIIKRDQFDSFTNHIHLYAPIFASKNIVISLEGDFPSFRHIRKMLCVCVIFLIKKEGNQQPYPDLDTFDCIIVIIVTQRDSLCVYKFIELNRKIKAYNVGTPFPVPLYLAVVLRQTRFFISST